MNPTLFDIDKFMTILQENYRHWKAPIITFLAHRGATPFEILVSTLLSLRTKDEVTAQAAQKLFKQAHTPEAILNLGEDTVANLIYPVGFYKTKAQRLVKISHILIDEYHSQVPDTIEKLIQLPGVGRKTANLVLIEGFKKEGLCVDTHVHRISNRVGYVKTTSADQTEFALRARLPKKYWISYNEILVAFGQVICRPISPFCTPCPVTLMCPKVNVQKYR